YVETGEDPLVAAQRELLEEAGLVGDRWRHLGSFVVDANRRVGTGHFYLVNNARQVAEPDADDLEAYVLRWVAPAELQAALSDGRVGVMGYAVAMGLGLLVLDSGQTTD
ncbi:MAG: NUDIX hydrolase, partial [Candidatus Promineifilaceae bacterium]|nr:NUDIX hydrolase [Candidatus Promineifilaceae bacterium]